MKRQPYSVQMHASEILNALTQLLNALLGSCNANQSLSERAYVNRGRSRFWWSLYRLINALAFQESDHCRKAYLREIRRCQQRLEASGHTVLPRVTSDPVLHYPEPR